MRWRVVCALRDWFASHGFDNIARWMNAALDGTLSDQARADLFAADLVRRARAFVENGPPRPVESSLAAIGCGTRSRRDPRKPVFHDHVTAARC